VLGAETTVTLDDHILGKPENHADAARMLRLLSGRTRRVITGLALGTSALPELVRSFGARQTGLGTEPPDRCWVVILEEANQVPALLADSSPIPQRI
jgi:hypothetical protein